MSKARLRLPQLAALAAVVLTAATGSANGPPKKAGVQTPVAPKKDRTGSKARIAAQRGLTSLAAATLSWQKKRRCYGCHVQAVTLEALVVGRQHAYDVRWADIEAIRDGMLNLSGGQRRPGGLSLRGRRLFADAKTFGGMALARYDALVDEYVARDLIDVARDLLEYQTPDGSFRLDAGGHPPPVKAGAMQGTFHAMETWRQAYVRTADEAWLAPVRKAEAYIQKTVSGWGHPITHAPMQDLNYALMGLAAAGASRDEVLAARLIARIGAVQNDDGGFGFRPEDKTSQAFATGQTLYALRTLGLTEQHPTVARATRWLIQHQDDSGQWSKRPSSKAEAMWAVLGLVGVDVVTFDVQGLVAGTRVDRATTLAASARVNSETTVKFLDLVVDDRPVLRRKGAQLTHRIDPAQMSTGRHVVELVATLSDGQTRHRRFEIFTGDVFLTDLATRYADGGTIISARTIGHDDEGQVVMKIRRCATDKKLIRPAEVVHTIRRPARLGALAYHWVGQPNQGRRFFAELTFVDAQGRARQSERLLFFHGRTEAQQRKYGEVAGKLKFGKDQKATTNSVVELVDDQGRVVQTTRTTQAGAYRFKNVSAGQYRVRMQKKGFKAEEQTVNARAGQESLSTMTAW